MNRRAIGALLVSAVTSLSLFGPIEDRDALTEWRVRRLCPSVAGLTPSAQHAFRRLFDAARFEGGAVGYAGLPSSGAQALQALLDGPKPIAALRDLLHHASPSGQLYALSGLAVMDHAAFVAGVKERTPPSWARLLPRQKVRTLFGCIEGDAYFDDLVAQIESGLAEDVTGRGMKVASR